ncbi:MULTISPECIES: hypothetical protein [unclassified Streptococcus]|uniref:hyaluronate lyase N-terminal domain-containing protein n=1 Tax=unclassified Streptococcus TaxID=2608887 RepID=UPI001564599E|nr:MULTISPECIES: hypothetical protein [unclassified Streptococcus]
MTETIPVRVQHKRMSASDWASSTLVLLDGELGIESDTGKVKVGNGRDRFSALQYLTGPKGDRGERGETGSRGADGVMRFENLTSQQRESLRGPQGVQGERGQQGLQGIQGPRGLTGAKGPAGPAGARGADGAPGQNIINQNGGQPMKYWSGTRSQYDAIANKDSNTIYDIFSQ